MSTPVSSRAPVPGSRPAGILDRLVPVSPQWCVPPRKAERFSWIQLVMGVLLFLGAQTASMFLVLITGSARLNDHGAVVFLRPDATLIMAVVGAPIVVIGYWLLVRYAGGRPVIELGGRGAALRELGVGLGVGALLMCAVIAVLALAGSYHVVDIGWSAGILGGLGAGLSAGFTEEILFRGILLRLIEGWLGTWWALAITSVLFGAAHLGNSHATAFGAVAIIVEAGILLGACYLLTRRLWLAIGVHIAWNFVQGGIFGSDVSGTGLGRGLIEARFTGSDLLTGGAMGIEGSVVAIVLCTVAGLAVLAAVHRRGLIVPPSWRRPAAPSSSVVGDGPPRVMNGSAPGARPAARPESR